MHTKSVIGIIALSLLSLSAHASAAPKAKQSGTKKTSEKAKAKRAGTMPRPKRGTIKFAAFRRSAEVAQADTATRVSRFMAQSRAGKGLRSYVKLIDKGVPNGARGGVDRPLTTVSIGDIVSEGRRVEIGVDAKGKLWEIDGRSPERWVPGKSEFAGFRNAVISTYGILLDPSKGTIGHTDLVDVE